MPLMIKYVLRASTLKRLSLITRYAIFIITAGKYRKVKSMEYCRISPPGNKLLAAKALTINEIW
jgi:hypothetical protein